MDAGDEFGHDPQVKYLRRVFAGMEKAQADLIRRLGVSPLDYRLRRIREASLKLFEEGWMLANRQGTISTEKEIAILYIHCLARVLSANRIQVPREELPAHDGISRFMKEVLK
jgi:hypothetical protein